MAKLIVLLCTLIAAAAVAGHEISQGHVAIRSAHMMFLSFSRDSLLVTAGESVEQFRIVHVHLEGDLGEQSVCIEATGEGFLSVRVEDSSVRLARRSKCEEIDRFDIVDVDGYGTIGLRSVVHGGYVSARSDQTVGLSAELQEWETFVLEDGSLFDAVESLHREGFVILENVLSPEEALDVKSVLAQVESVAGRMEVHDGKGVQIRVPDLIAHHAVFSELLTHPRVLGPVEMFLHKMFRCATWSSNTLLPNMSTPALGWHVDYPYHDIEQPWPKEPLSLQVLWMLDDFTEQNGATMFMPDSHKWLRVPAYDFSSPTEASRLLTKAGSVLIAHGAWWHRQTENKTNQTRSALLASFCRGFVVPKADMEGQLMRAEEQGLLSHLDARQRARVDRLVKGWHGRGLRNVYA